MSNFNKFNNLDVKDNFLERHSYQLDKEEVEMNCIHNLKFFSYIKTGDLDALN